MMLRWKGIVRGFRTVDVRVPPAIFDRVVRIDPENRAQRRVPVHRDTETYLS